MSASTTDPRKVFIGYFIDIVAPLATYYLFNALHIPPIVGGIACAAVAVVSTVRNTIKQKGIDKFGALVILEIAVSIAFLGLHGDPRIFMVKPAVLLIIAGVYAIFHSIKGKPLNYAGARAMATRKDPARGPLFDQAWETSQPFRSTVRFMSLLWGFAFILDGTIRIIIVYSVTPERAIVLANTPHIVTISLLIAFSALAGRRMGELVDRMAAETNQAPLTN